MIIPLILSLKLAIVNPIAQTRASKSLSKCCRSECIDTQVYGDHTHLIADVTGHLDAREGDDQKDFRFTAVWLFTKHSGSGKWEIVAQMWKNTPAAGSAF